MTSRLYLLTEMLYGTGLLTVITAVPEIKMNYRINPVQAPKISVSFPSIGVYTVVAFLLTALAMLPTLVTLPNFLTRRLRCHFLALLPWIWICCLQFGCNTIYHLISINEVGRVDNPTFLKMALGMYWLIFGMATELILHWIATCHLRTDGMPFEVRWKLEPRA